MNNYDYGIIGNCTSAALVSSDCSIDWLCLPFFDSPSVFGRILDKDKGGFFKISAVDLTTIRQNYLPHTPILRTVFETKKGIFEVRDYMPRFVTSMDEYFCPPEIHRDILLISGEPEIVVELDPMPNYAMGKAKIFLEDRYVKIISQKGEYNSFYLYSNLDHEKIIAGQPVKLIGTAYILLSYHEKLEKISTDKIYIEYEKTKTYWLDWASRTKLPEKHRDLLIRSAITLKLLTFQRTGAVIAAPTTSLPEIIGKERNWDYRYCWIRDASMIIDLYIRIGHMKSAARFINFILNRRLLKHENISIMYSINGEKELEEKVLGHLQGYESSKPVRIGNDAYRQTQSDLYGQLIETIYTYFIVNKRGMVVLDEEMWTIVRSLAYEVLNNWQKEDSGIWERRCSLRHYVHSKMMNWVAMDRAAKIAQFVGSPKYTKKWLEAAGIIKKDILKNGWSKKAMSFTMCYGSDALDASNLLMLHYGFLKSTDPKMASTVKQAYKHLVRNGFVLRYMEEDEFGFPENAFIVCTFWMINALYLIGEEEKAMEMFENILGCANKLGLYSEDIDVVTKRLTGNFPQGYSHMALIQTAFLLETAYNWSDAFSYKTAQ